VNKIPSISRRKRILSKGKVGKFSHEKILPVRRSLNIGLPEVPFLVMKKWRVAIFVRNVLVIL